MNKTAIVPPGIGDIIWVIQKLINTGEQFEFLIPDGSPQRGKQVLDLLPQLAASARYAPDLSYRWIARNNTIRGQHWKHVCKHQRLVISANEHLEAGQRLESFLPDLPTSFHLDYQTSREDKEFGKQFAREGDVRHVGIYMSSLSNSAHYGGWTTTDWFYLIRFLWWRGTNLGLSVRFVLVGASYDQDAIDQLSAILIQYSISHVALIDSSFGRVVESLRQFDYFISFPSGLGVLNETLGKAGTMFYGAHLHGLMKTWASLDRLESRQFNETQFCRPEELYTWLKTTYRIFER